tara:strand:- start:79 stop:906 length:828 start_codon:yes stop_codon:yes gene_type:complete
MENKYFFHHSNSRFFKISGEDSKSFIQNLITNDISKCENNKIIYSCILTPQGRFIADFFILKKDGYYIFETDKKFFENLLNRLNIYKLRSNIVIEQIHLFSYSLFNYHYDSSYLIQSKDPRNLNIGIKLILQKKIGLLQNNLEEIDETDYHEILISNNIPYSPIDLLESKSLLLENNFDNLNAIDWQKGCYVGQEITARMKYRGLLKKKLYSLKVYKGDITNDKELLVNGKKIGHIISKAHSKIFAVLNIEFVDELRKKSKKLELDSSLVLDFLD